MYRIDAATGTIVQSRNLCTPVPMSSLPGACSTNSAVVGITSTPVIDVSTQTLYVMTYTMESGSQVYRVHALDLGTLADARINSIPSRRTRRLDRSFRWHTQSPDSQPTLDARDLDLGSGGVLLIPYQPSLPMPYLALSIGKAGYYYLLNRGSTFSGPTSLSKISERLDSGDDCHCANSYFTGADGVPRVVSGVGDELKTFKLQGSSGSVVMTPEDTQTLSSGQDGGFFTSVSSNGTTAGSAVIWSVTRPTSSPYAVHLVAFDDPHNAIIYTSSGTKAGTWPNTNGNANLVPVVADGRVFVSSYKNLAIFGVGGSP